MCVYLKRALPRVPFYTGLRLYFADAPRVYLDFTGGRVGDWLERIISSVIVAQLGKRLVLPEAINILLDKGKASDPEGWFQLHRILPEGVVRVSVSEAEDLAAMDGMMPWQT